jgi:phage baseplate assembly protein V
MMDLYRLLQPLYMKIMLMIGRGSVKGVNNSGDVGLIPSSGDKPQRIQIEAMANETLTDMERWQEYGLETYPNVDAEALVGFIDGDRSNGQVICVQDKTYRPTDLSEGDVVLYDYNGVQIGARSGKIVVGKKNVPMTSTPTAANTELLEIVDRILTVLQGTLNLGGMASMTTFLPAVLVELAKLQADLNNIKGSF